MINHQTAINNAAAEHRAAKAAVKNEREELNTATASLAAQTDARGIIQSVAHAVQQEAHSRIAGVVTRCMQAVFGPDAYTFNIEFEQRRGRTEARLVFERDGLELVPLQAAGGGSVDVAAFALRLACMMLQRPPVRRVLILDEPFRFVSVGYRPAVRQLLLDLADELGMQFVIVTHDPAFIAGRVIEIEK